MTLKQRFINNAEVEGLASGAVTNYENSCSWRSAGQAAKEDAAEYFGVRLTSAQVGTVVNVAKQKWEAIVISTKAAIAGE
jgi:hypothetical protein